MLIDCDPGVDDALAIALGANSGKLDIRGISTVHGNMGIDQVTINALKVVEYLNLEIPVARGLARPLRVERVAASDFHGKDGLGNSGLPVPTRRAEEDAVEFIARGIRDEGVRTVVATGPLTNIAEAFRKHCKVMESLDELVMMGGSVCRPGNITRYAEFNFYADPHAAKYVLEQKVEKTLVPLNVTERVIFTPQQLASLGESRTARLAKRIVPVYQQYCMKHEGFPGNPLHDPLAVGYAIDNTFLKTRKLGLAVRTGIPHHRGECAVEGEPNVNVALEVDSERFLNYFIDVIATLDSFKYFPSGPPSEAASHGVDDSQHFRSPTWL